MTDFPYPFRFKLYQSLADYSTAELEAELRRRAVHAATAEIADAMIAKMDGGRRSS